MNREIHLVVMQTDLTETVESYTLKNGVVTGKVKTTCTKYESVSDAVTRHILYVRDMLRNE